MSHTSKEEVSSKTSQDKVSQTSQEKVSEKSSDSLVGFTFGEEESEPEEEQPVVVEEEQPKSTFFDRVYLKTKYEEYKKRQLKESPLFAEVLTLDKDKGVTEETQSDKPSILVTGFGIRNLESLQNALQDDEERLRELYKYKASSMEEGYSSRTTSSKGPSTATSKRSTETETDRSSIRTDLSAQKMQLQYLLGIETDAEEEHVEEEKEGVEEVDDFTYSTRKSTREAQKYLRVHRIFDFYQVIIAHLLSALPENPIDFILVYLNKCLCYRSGLGKPPLLYEEKHIEQLYKLMDRMNTGFIELDQYNRGMTTLGICEYNKNPPVSREGLVSKEFFVQEALECETAIFDDLIRRRWIGKRPPSEPAGLDFITPSIAGPYFIPSDLMIKVKRYEQELAKVVEDEEEWGFYGGE